MIHVVICSKCGKIFLVNDNPKTTKCRRCNKTHQLDKIKILYSGQNKIKALRARTLAKEKYSSEDKPTKEAIESIEEGVKRTPIKKMIEEIVKNEGEIDYGGLTERSMEELDISKEKAESSIDEIIDKKDFVHTPEDKVKYVSFI